MVIARSELPPTDAREGGMVPVNSPLPMNSVEMLERLPIELGIVPTMVVNVAFVHPCCDAHSPTHPGSELDEHVQGFGSANATSTTHNTTQSARRVLMPTHNQQSTTSSQPTAFKKDDRASFRTSVKPNYNKNTNGEIKRGQAH